MTRIGAVLLAAGASTRFGAGNKLLAELGGRPLVAHAADALLASGVDEIVVVTGRDSEQVRQILARTAVRFAHNEGWIRGMGSSIANGLRALGSQPSGAFVVPGDMPFITTGTIATLRDRFIRAGGERIVVPTTPEGAQRNPVLWPRRCFAELALLSGAEGGKPLLKRYSDQTVCVAFADALALTDVDTAEDLEAARRQLALRAP
jgi:molybdenum cofactor cytidylyltransferase